jgi:hypothetical protein
LRDGFLPREQERKPFYKRRAVSLAISLALHSFLVYGLYHVGLTIKLLPLGREVRNVRLAPPVRLTVPGRIEDYIQNYPAPGPFELGRRRPATRPASGPKKTPGAPPENAEVRKSGLAPENLMKNGLGTPPASGEFLSGDLALNSKYRDEEDGKLRINLLAIPDHVQDAPLGFEGGVPSGRSFRRYVLPGLASASGGRARPAPGTGGGTGEGGQRASAVFQSPGYDISPWAKKVMDLVQLNWAIPSAPNLTGRSTVRVAVTIERSGAFSAFEVSELADLELFNSAAAIALKASEPFPALPDDFPASNLTAVFVFTYHD